MAGPLNPRCVINSFSRNCWRPIGCDHLGGDSRQVAIVLLVLRMEDEGNQERAGIREC